MVGGRKNVKGCSWLLTHPCCKERVPVYLTNQIVVYTTNGFPFSSVLVLAIFLHRCLLINKNHIYCC